MARPRRQPNPLLPRLQHVADTYDPWVTYMTAMVWAEATGQHNLAADLVELYEGRQPGMPLQRSQEVVDAAAQLVRELGAPTSTRFDRHLPWVAREINKRAKKAVKLAATAFGRPITDFHQLDFFADAVPGSAKAKWLERHRGTQVPMTQAELDLVHAANAAESHARTSADELTRRFRPIVDWVEAEGVDLGRYSAQEALDEAQRYGLERTVATIAAGRVVYEWADGWTIQELNTEAQLTGESDVMQHCVENYTVDEKGGVWSDSYEAVQIFSLRDPKGEPHATMEFSVDDPQIPYVVQLRGKQNAKPMPEYLKRMVEWRHHLPKIPLTRLPVERWPDHADGLSVPFVGAFIGVPDVDVVLVYADGSVLDAELFRERGDFVRLRAENQFPGDGPAQRQYIIETFDQTTPIETEAMTEDTATLSWIPWSVFIESGGKVRMPGGGDELMEWLAGTPIDASLCLPFRRELAQQRRGMRLPAQLNRSQLKAALMRG